MATVKLIAELHEIKESMCNAVRHVPEFTAVQQNTRITNHISYGQQVQLTAPVGSTWTSVGNLTQEFERIIKLCGKGNAFDINVKKFELREKIALSIKIKKLCSKNVQTDFEDFLPDLFPDFHISREPQATALHTRLTTLINMIPVKNSNTARVKHVKKIVVVKELTPPTPVVAKISPTIQTPLKTPKSEEEQALKTPQIQQNTQHPKTKTHQISLENYEIRALKQSDCLLQINNLSEFANVQFYFHKSQYNELYLHYKGHAQYLIGNDHKLYVISGARLVQGSHYDKLQCWTL